MNSGGTNARVLAALLLTAMALTPLPALAADAATAQAKLHFKQGQDLYRQGHYHECAQEFEASYAARPHGVTLFNAAQCYERAEEYLKAADYYREYLKATPNAPDRSAVDALIRSLDIRAPVQPPEPASTPREQTLVVLSTPSSAHVNVDGKPRGMTPLTDQLSVGAHQVDVTLQDFRPQSRAITLRPDRPLTLDLKLDAAGPPPPPAAVAASVVRDTYQPAPPRRRVWTWVALGAAGAAEIVGGILGASAASQQKALDTGFVASRQTADKHLSTLRSTAAGANVFYVAGGVLFAGSVTLFFLEGR